MAKKHDEQEPAPPKADVVVLQNDSNPLSLPQLRLLIDQGETTIEARGKLTAKERWEEAKKIREVQRAMAEGTLRVVG